MSSQTTEHSKGHHDSHGEQGKGENSLGKIKDKELALRGKYLETKKQAEIIVAEARKKASEIRRTATDKAIKEAQEYYEKKVAEIRNETVKVSEEEVINVNKIAEKKIPIAKDFLIKNIIPE